MSWKQKLLRTPDGQLNSKSGANVTLILENDPTWSGVFAFDWSINVVVLRRACPATINGEHWDRKFGPRLISDWFEMTYAMRPSLGDIRSTVEMLARRNPFNGRHELVRARDARANERAQQSIRQDEES